MRFTASPHGRAGEGIETAAGPWIARQGRFSVKVVGGYRLGVRKLSTWLEHCIGNCLPGHCRVTTVIEASGHGAIAHVDAATAGSDATRTTVESQADLLIALDAGAILGHGALLRDRTICLVVDAQEDADGIADALSADLQARVSELLGRQGASGYWLPLWAELIAPEEALPDAKLIAVLGAASKAMGLHLSGDVIGFEPITWGDRSAYAPAEEEHK